jgi:hypothetical protein
MPVAGFLRPPFFAFRYTALRLSIPALLRAPPAAAIALRFFHIPLAQASGI